MSSIPGFHRNRCQSGPQLTDPFESVNVGIIAFDTRAANASSFEPCSADRAKSRKLILAVFHQRQVCDKRDVYLKLRESFDKASQPLRRRIENPVHAHRVVEAIAKGSIFLGIGPVRNRPCVAISAESA
jgi:hypothetical protein